MGEIAAELAAAKAEAEQTGKAARCFKDFRYQTLDSWSCQRRVVGKAEQLVDGSGETSANPRFVVTSLERRGLGGTAALRAALLRPRRDGEPDQGVPARPVRRPHLHPNDAGQSTPAVVRFDGLRAAGSAAPDRACRRPGSPRPRRARSASSCSRSARWCASRSAGSRSRWPPATPGSATGPSPTPP